MIRDKSLNQNRPMCKGFSIYANNSEEHRWRRFNVFPFQVEISRMNREYNDNTEKHFHTICIATWKSKKKKKRNKISTKWKIKDSLVVDCLAWCDKYLKKSICFSFTSIQRHSWNKNSIEIRINRQRKGSNRKTRRFRYFGQSSITHRRRRALQSTRPLFIHWACYGWREVTCSCSCPKSMYKTITMNMLYLEGFIYLWMFASFQTGEFPLFIFCDNFIIR